MLLLVRLPLLTYLTTKTTTYDSFEQIINNRYQKLVHTFSFVGIEFVTIGQRYQAAIP